MSEDRINEYESVRQAFLSVQDSTALAELTDKHPFMLEADFHAAVEGWIAEAESALGWEVATGLRERLEVLRELAGEDVSQWQAALEAFATARSADDLLALVRSQPLIREPAFQSVVADLVDHAEAEGDHDDAAALRVRLDDLRTILDGAPTVTLASVLEQMRTGDLHADTIRAENPELVDQAEREALALLKNLRDQQQLLALVAQAPLVLDDPFIKRVEAAMIQADQQGDRALVGDLQARLEGLKLIKAQVQVTVPQTLEAFAAVHDSGELLALAQRVPFVLEERFIRAVERAISELDGGGGHIEAEGLRVRLDALRALRQQQEIADQSPVMHALIDFLNAHDDESAIALYSAQRELLDSVEAQRTLDEEFSGGDQESQKRIQERAALLRTLRAG